MGHAPHCAVRNKTLETYTTISESRHFWAFTLFMVSASLSFDASMKSQTRFLLLLKNEVTFCFTDFFCSSVGTWTLNVDRATASMACDLMFAVMVPLYL
jgi:hypothetical protein